MNRAGARTPEELARVTDTYRDTTGGDVRTLNARASLSRR
jgi:5-methylphenazine-1-carboxylate 1-monooxygenase